jgi:hypothetical protein
MGMLPSASPTLQDRKGRVGLTSVYTADTPLNWTLHSSC